MLLNPSPMDEHGEGGYESGWWCQAKCKPRAGWADTITLRNSVEIFTKLYTPQDKHRGREVGGAKGHTKARFGA